MCVCVFVYMYVCVCLNVCMGARGEFVNVHVRVYDHVCMFKCLDFFISIYKHPMIKVM